MAAEHPGHHDAGGGAGGLLWQRVNLGATSQHACGITTAGAAYCWGDNIRGQIGDGTTDDRSVPTPVERLRAGPKRLLRPVITKTRSAPRGILSGVLRVFVVNRAVDSGRTTGMALPFTLPPGASGAHPRLRSYPWNLIRLIPAKGARHGRPLAPAPLPSPILGAPHGRHPARRPPARLRPITATPSPTRTKVYVDGSRGIRVPMREIALSGGEPPLRVYDTSGPQGHDVREGLPTVRAAWIAARRVEGCRASASERGDRSLRRSSHSAQVPAPLGMTPRCAAGAHHPAPLRPPRRDHRRRWSSPRSARG